MDATIGVEGYKVKCIIGCKGAEREREQELLFDLKVRADVSRCCASDDIADAVDYMTLAHHCTDAAVEGRYHLLEALAAAILERVLRHPSVQYAWLRIRKPGALESASWTSVEIDRSREVAIR